MVYIATLEAMLIDFSKAPQVKQPDDVILTAILWNNIPTKIPAKYADYANIFSSDLVMQLFKNNGINKYTIELIENK